MLKEFRDIAIGTIHFGLRLGGIIGAAFGAIVSSLIDDVIMPAVAVLDVRVDFSELFLVSGNPNSVPVSAAKAGGRVTPNIGLFINAVVDSSVSPSVCFSSSRALTV